MTLFTIIKRLVLVTPLVVSSLLLQHSTSLQAQAPAPCNSNNGAPCPLVVTKPAPIPEKVSPAFKEAGVNLSNMFDTNRCGTVGTIGSTKNLEIVIALINRADGTLVTIVGERTEVTVYAIAMPTKQNNAYLPLIQR